VILKSCTLSRTSDTTETRNPCAQFKETLISFNNKQELCHWKGVTIKCYGKSWPNFLSEATFNKTKFWFIFFSFVWHKILVLIFNMFIYAKVGHSKFVEMHGNASDFYWSTLVFYTRQQVNISVLSIELYT
jgi:hypothetical protein